ncbi:hypothetical protein [Glycomyces sp. MUSA5-2]|uniref:hypothetical protein n=1 Tax=Glycomyces sp. MUSA5-2 TaxID=2053002 RepID=UPI00300961E6
MTAPQTQTRFPAPLLPAAAEHADPAHLAAAAARLDADIAHLRDQTRAADAKAAAAMTAVGLIAAAATAVLPRLDGPALAVAAAALVLVVAAGVSLGVAIVPRTRRSPYRLAHQIADRALRLAAHPVDGLADRAAEAYTLGEVVDLKHTLLRLAFAALGGAVFLAAAAALITAIEALT